ncbi:DoxX family protein [Streptomyces sp. NPDC048182]|uniref:DoxX family protein n=1 Tax=Streptomyces sp. NPDC048182 TaxID=3365507 RepID=UPI003723DDC3
MPRSDRSALALAGLLAGAGVLHFARPRPFDATVPQSLPGSPRAWTYASGVAELALAAGLAAPRTRRTSARAAAAFFVGVFPANVKMAYDWRDKPAPLKRAAYGRLPLQVPLVLWARGVARGAGQGREGA